MITNSYATFFFNSENTFHYGDMSYYSLLLYATLINKWGRVTELQIFLFIQEQDKNVNIINS